MVEVDGAEHRMAAVTSFHARGQGEEEVPGGISSPVHDGGRRWAMLVAGGWRDWRKAGESVG